MSLQIKHIETDSFGEFTAWSDDQQAGEMTYTRPNPDTIIINHTQNFLALKVVASLVRWSLQP